jgi:DNA helicase-2/ATP-dependent DNA helicase PcrA
LAPGALGSPTGEEEPGDRPDVSAALAAASPELDEGTPDTPLLGFLEQLALVGDADAAEGGERVSLMTLHAAKGLEFDAVWLTGLEERVFPHARSLGQGAGGSGEEDADEMAEERRLCYVGLTRARKKLTLTLSRCRSLFGELRFNPPSRFVREIPEELATGLGALAAAEPRPQPGGKWERGWGGKREGDAGHDYEFDQRPRWDEESRPFGQRPSDAPMPPRNRARESRTDPLSRPPAKEAAPGIAGLGPGARVRHPSFGVGTVEDTDGQGPNLKLTVRFPPGVGLKKVLARFVERA